LGTVFLALALSGAAVFPGGPSAVSAAENTICAGIHVEGVDIGGMSETDALAAIQNKVNEMGAAPVTLLMGDNTVSSTLAQLGYTWTNTDVLDSLMTIGTSGTIVDRYKQKKDIENAQTDFPLEFTVDESKVKAVVEQCSAYNCDPVEGSIALDDNGVPYVEGGTDGLTLKVDESVKKVADAISAWTGGDLSVELEVDRVSPQLSKDKLANVKDVLGSATTDYSASTAQRAVNVENGCSKINGSLVWPGDEFSVTRAVTPFTAENGYEEAPTYEENRTVDSYGGGICQVSTTLYNAVLKAELDVTARSNHTMMVGYVDPSKDAAIAEGIMDFAFINNTDSPIYLAGYCYNGTITFTIYGHETRDPARTLEFESKVLSQTDPTGTQLYADSTQPVGYVQQTQSPHTGYSAELWKNIYYNGELQDSVQINSSVYQAVGTIYDIGVASSNAALTQAMVTAVASNDLTAVQNVIKNGASASASGKTDAQGNAAQQQTTAAQPADGSVTIVQ